MTAQRDLGLDNSLFTFDIFRDQPLIFDTISSLLKAIELLNQQVGQLENKPITLQMSRLPTSGCVPLLL